MQALAQLCHIKRSLEFSEQQLETWLTCLRPFDAAVVSEAVIAVALSDKPFPQLGEIIERCRRLTDEVSQEYAPSKDYKKLPSTFVRKVAATLGLQTISDLRRKTS